MSLSAHKSSGGASRERDTRLRTASMLDLSEMPSGVTPVVLRKGTLKGAVNVLLRGRRNVGDGKEEPISANELSAVPQTEYKIQAEYRGVPSAFAQKLWAALGEDK